MIELAYSSCTSGRNKGLTARLTCGDVKKFFVVRAEREGTGGSGEGRSWLGR